MHVYVEVGKNGIVIIIVGAFTASFQTCNFMWRRHSTYCTVD